MINEADVEGLGLLFLGDESHMYRPTWAPMWQNPTHCISMLDSREVLRQHQ